MIYTQMFNLLCEKADDVYGGRLPVHVRCLIDEAANIGQIPNLEKLVATIRSREISACLVLQAKSQLKAIYKDNADTIIGNMDSQIFLGGTEQTTLKDLNAILGKETIDMYNTGQSKGSQESYNMNYQKLGKDLMTMDELAVMDGSKCIVQVRGVRPFLSDKYDLTQHPNYKLTADYDVSSAFLQKCMNDPEKAKYLEENLAAIPDCTKDTINGCLGTVTNQSYMIDANGNIIETASCTNDPDGKIAKENAERKAKENREKEEKVKEKRAAKKAEEEKAAKKRAEKSAEGKETGDYTLSVTGNDVKSMTQSLVAESVSISAPDRSSFDIKA